ncbi:MAG: hypothetical protein R6V01_07330 [Thermoplasmatota archaeon]
MARFKEESALHADPDHVWDLLQRAAGELDLIMEEDCGGKMLLKEKYRFDHYNQVELEVDLEGLHGDCRLLIDGQNHGEGEVQEKHVRSKVLELLSRIQIDLEYLEPRENPINDAGALKELELLSDLHSRNILTDHEYATAKKRILGTDRAPS